MAFQKVKKLLGITAVVVCCGTVMFTFTGCENKQVAPETVQMQEIQSEIAPEEGNAIANDIDLSQTEVEAQTEEEIHVTYTQCATEDDTLTMVNNEQVNYKVKDYLAPNFFEYMQGLDYNYEVNEEEGYVANDTRVVSDNYEITEDGKLLVRDMKMNTAIPVVKYVRISPDEVEARYIGTAPNDSNLVSGITFVMEKNEDGYYKLTGMRGVFDEDITGLEVYEGTFNGWAVEQGGVAVYDADDEIMISGDIILYPHFTDNEAGKLAKEDGTCLDDQIEEIEIDGVKHTVLRVIHIKGTKTDAKTGEKVSCDKYALAGLDAKKDTVKTKDGQTIDKDKVEKQQTEEKDPAAKTDPQTSKKSNESPKPGQEKPASSANEQSQAEDTANRTDEQGSTTDVNDGIAAWGVGCDANTTWGDASYSCGDLHWD